MNNDLKYNLKHEIKFKKSKKYGTEENLLKNLKRTRK